MLARTERQLQLVKLQAKASFQLRRVAEKLVASGEAEATDAQRQTHELILNEKEEGEEGKEGADCTEPDEADWALDGAAVEYENQKADHAATKARKKDYLSRSSSRSAGPGTKSRSFVRAFPPVLETTGLSQGAFLRFLKAFDVAAQASPILDVVMVAATAMASISPGFLISLGIQIVQVAAAIEEEV
ncbi:MAG: hypothetical protein Q9210_001205 [Variospora velana]